MHTYLILGYGIPKDIMIDDNYRRYLGIVFNAIYQESKGEKACLVFCGGKTDIRKPYKRSEAREMGRLVNAWMKDRARKEGSGKWVTKYEERSLSTLENLMYAKRFVSGSLTVFCEATRASRVRKLAKEIFKSRTVQICPIDFDLSLNRYLDPTFIQDKEDKTLKIERWALKNQKNLKIYRQALLDRLAHFRRIGPQGHVHEIKAWWETRLTELSLLTK